MNTGPGNRNLILERVHKHSSTVLKGSVTLCLQRRNGDSEGPTSPGCSEQPGSGHPACGLSAQHRQVSVPRLSLLGRHSPSSAPECAQDRPQGPGRRQQPGKSPHCHCGERHLSSPRALSERLTGKDAAPSAFHGALPERNTRHPLPSQSPRATPGGGGLNCWITGVCGSQRVRLK